MLRNLVINSIPADETEFRRLLKKLGDYTWNNEAITTFCDSNTNVIFYDKDCEAYVWDNKGNIPKDVTLVHKSFNQVVRG